MKKYFGAWLGLFLLVFPVLLSADTITLVADEWCPYNCEPDAAEPGFAVEAAKQIFEAAGHQVTYTIMDWDQSVEETRAGKHHAIIGAAKGDAPDFVFPDEAIANAASCFYVRKGDGWTYQGAESLKARKIGCIEGYDYTSDEIANNTFGNVVRKESLAACVEALLGEEVDTIVEDAYVFQLFELENHIAGSTDKAGCLEAGLLYIAFSPANPKSAEYAALLSKGLAAMKANGEWTALLKKYGVE